MFESQPEFGKKSGSNQGRTQELLGHPDAYRILFSSCRTRESIILQFKNPESYQTVARLMCIGGKRHILQILHRFMTHLVSTILVLGLCDLKLDLELQT